MIEIGETGRRPDKFGQIIELSSESLRFLIFRVT